MSRSPRRGFTANIGWGLDGRVGRSARSRMGAMMKAEEKKEAKREPEAGDRENDVAKGVDMSETMQNMYQMTVSYLFWVSFNLL